MTRRLRPGALAAFHPPHQAVGKLVDHDRLTAQRVQRLAREAAGRLGDDGSKICLADKRIDVDAIDEVIHVHAFEQAVDVNALDDRLHVHAFHQAIHIDMVEQAIDVHAVEEFRHVHPVEHVVEVDAVECGGQVDLADDLVHVERLDDNVDHAFGDNLGERLHGVSDPPPSGAQSIERIHGCKLWSLSAIRIAL